MKKYESVYVGLEKKLVGGIDLQLAVDMEKICEAGTQLTIETKHGVVVGFMSVPALKLAMRKIGEKDETNRNNTT